jgi:tetratricopeptide (TPR) repeat protein
MGQINARAYRRHAAIPLYKRAVQLDPNFAEGWRALGSTEWGVDYFEDALADSQKAYDLRERVSELERLQIESSYYAIRGNRRRDIEILEVTVQAYPRSSINWNNLAYSCKRDGQDEKAVRAFRRCLEVDPDRAAPTAELIDLLFGMNRVKEASEACVYAANHHMDPSVCRLAPLSSAFRAGDAAAVKRQVDLIAALPRGPRLREQKTFAAFQGRIGEAREIWRPLAKCYQCASDAPFDSETLLAEAAAGRCDLVERDLAGGKPDRDEIDLPRAAFAAAACQDPKRTQAFTAEFLKISPNDTFKHDVFAPCVQALAARSGDPLPPAAVAYDVTRRDTMSPAGTATLYCRGEIFLAQKKGAEAAAQFQTLVDNPSWSALDVFYAPAWAGLARAADMAGDAERSRKAYDEFFRLWKTADADLPLLIQAKRESDEAARTRSASR